MNYLSWKILIVDVALQPIRITHWTKALMLVILNKAEALSYYKDVFIHSQKVTMPLPNVIKIKKYVGYGKNLPRFSRLNIMFRDNFTCQYCGKQEKKDKLTMDHIIPKSQGGKKGWSNIVTSCVPCNQKKSNRTPEQANMSLIRIPSKLKKLPSLILKSSDPEEWHHYFR